MPKGYPKVPIVFKPRICVNPNCPHRHNDPKNPFTPRSNGQKYCSRACYQKVSNKRRNKRYRNLNPLFARPCACGCTLLFTPKTRNQIYLDKHHRRSFYNKLTKRITHGFFLCLDCSQYGVLQETVWIPTGRSHFDIVHRKKQWNPQKYQSLRKQGFSSKEANNRAFDIVIVAVHPLPS